MRWSICDRRWRRKLKSRVFRDGGKKRTTRTKMKGWIVVNMILGIVR